MATTTHQTTSSSRRPTFSGSALFSLVFLVSLILPTLLMAPLQARHSTPPLPPPTGLSDPRELATFLGGVLSVQLADDHIPGVTVAVVKDGRLFFAKGMVLAICKRQAGQRPDEPLPYWLGG